MDKQRILVVDDEIRMCESLDTLLSSRGYDIQCFTDGGKALSYIQDQGCDLVLLDLMMPEMDGFTVLSRIKKNFPDVQVIIMTAQGSAEYAVAALKGGADDYLCKPFEIDKLIKRIQNTLKTSRLSKENALINGKLAMTEAQLRQAQKMEAIGTLAGGIAHDFNNILMGIQGHLSLMLFQIDATHPFHPRLMTLEKLVESGSKLTSQLLGYARKGRYEVKPIDLNSIISGNVETFKRMRKDVLFIFDFAENLSLVEADTGQMEQILMNLFVNAADAMPDGGEIIVRTENTMIQAMPVQPFTLKPGHYVLLTISDMGVGMDEATRERIFEPFFTTKEMGRGTGLGLASVYGIVKGHDGYIDVQSEPNKGTTFRIYFPVSQQPAVAENEPSIDHLLRGVETILFVDDEDEIVTVSKSLLEVMGYRVLTARNGQEALQIYGQQKNNIDIVLLDMIMPGMNGERVYEKLKEINPDVRILLLSGYSKDREATAVLAKQCGGFIQKPFKINDLSRSIRQAMECRTDEQQ
ncbi:MAG: response regulator [Deltaproteobacteria bacterium]|nr:response regulator [Deltaproteobacteria bacterium]